MTQSSKKRGRRKDTAADEPRVGHSAKILPSLKTEIETEAPLRGHTASEATEHILSLGLPLYRRQFKPKYAPAK